jgi:hypothetical protein
VHKNEAGVKILSEGPRLISDGEQPNIHKGFHNVTVSKKVTSEGATVKDIPLIKKMSHWLKKRAPKEVELPLDHQIYSLKEDRDLMCAIERADADITALKESVELFNRNCSILCP